jgi:hypothetical protein
VRWEAVREARGWMDSVVGNLREALHRMREALHHPHHTHHLRRFIFTPITRHIMGPLH